MIASRQMGHTLKVQEQRRCNARLKIALVGLISSAAEWHANATRLPKGASEIDPTVAFACIAL